MNHVGLQFKENVKGLLFVTMLTIINMKEKLNLGFINFQKKWVFYHKLSITNLKLYAFCSSLRRLTHQK